MVILSTHHGDTRNRKLQRYYLEYVFEHDLFNWDLTGYSSDNPRIPSENIGISWGYRGGITAFNLTLGPVGWNVGISAAIQ